MSFQFVRLLLLSYQSQVPNVQHIMGLYEGEVSWNVHTTCYVYYTHTYAYTYVHTGLLVGLRTAVSNCLVESVSMTQSGGL